MTALFHARIYSENVVVSGLDLKQDATSVTISWKANVPTGEFRIYRGYSPLRGTKILGMALLIAAVKPDGLKEGKLYSYPNMFTDTVSKEGEYYYLVLPEKDSYTDADFRADENYNTSVMTFPYDPEAADKKKAPAEILIDETPEGLRIRVSAVQFANNKAELSPASVPVLDRVYDTIRKILDNPDEHGLSASSRIEIGGHTDDRGSASSNKNLSQRRAKAVFDYLVKKGLDAKILTAVGYGGTKPVKEVTPDLSKKEADANRALNRRVEFFIRK